MGVNLTSHADNHDLDKLARWNGDLSSWEDVSFPVYALFLVSPEDKAAHDVFRKYRDSFESRGASFGNLVIFGQHGISTTVRGILEGLGLDLGNLPLLALFSNPTGPTVHTLSLPAGAPESSSPPPASSEPEHWRDVLKRWKMRWTGSLITRTWSSSARAPACGPGASRWWNWSAES